MDGRTDGQTENIYSIFRDKLLLLGEHVYKMTIFLSVFTYKFICNTDRPLSICKFVGPLQIDRLDFLHM